MFYSHYGYFYKSVIPIVASYINCITIISHNYHLYHQLYQL